MQRVGALQGDYDVTIGVPSVLNEMFLHAVSQELRDALFSLLVAGQLGVVGRSEQHLSRGC